MRVDNCYILLWRSVLMQLVIDLVALNEKPKYKIGVSLKALKYWKKERESFLMLCDLAYIDSSYMDLLLQKVYDKREEISVSEKTRFVKFLKVFFKKLEVK